MVTTACYEARRFGVGSAMPAARARRLCPDGVYLPPDFPYYRDALARGDGGGARPLDARARSWGSTRPTSTSRGLPAPAAAMRRLAHEMRERTTGLHCSIGIGPNKLVAKVASDAEKPRGFVVLSASRPASASPQSPCGLIPGIGPKTAERLARAGLDTLGQLAAAPPEQLAAPFGARLGAALQRRARFEDDSAGHRGAQGRLRVARDHLRRRHRRPGGARADSRRLTEQLCSTLVARSAAAARSGSRCAWTTSPPTPARAPWPSRWPRWTACCPWRWTCCGASRAPRPVRLLGVRVAGLESGTPSHAEQLTLLV